jgi:hypothetical protein
VADKEHFLVKQDHSHSGFYWQTAAKRFDAALGNVPFG